MKKLYRVTIEKVIYVVAEDRRSAEDVGRMHEGECDDPDISACEPNSIATIQADGFDGDARPYDDTYNGYAPDDPTCVQWFERRFGLCPTQGCGNYRKAEGAETCPTCAQTKELLP